MIVVCLISSVEYRWTLRKTEGVVLVKSDGSAKLALEFELCSAEGSNEKAH